MTDNTNFYFQNYQQWREALTVRCKINLTPEYAQERIASLENAADPHTKEFKQKYGDEYLQQVIAWFKQSI